MPDKLTTFISECSSTGLPEETTRPRGIASPPPSSSVKKRRDTQGYDHERAHTPGSTCAFVGREGRCTETAGLQYHHRIPFAAGGPTTVDNLELRGPAHNLYQAEQWFGPLFVRETAGAWGGATEAPSA